MGELLGWGRLKIGYGEWVGGKQGRAAQMATPPRCHLRRGQTALIAVKYLTRNNNQITGLRRQLTVYESIMYKLCRMLLRGVPPVGPLLPPADHLHRLQHVLRSTSCAGGGGGGCSSPFRSVRAPGSCSPPAGSPADCAPDWEAARPPW